MSYPMPTPLLYNVTVDQKYNMGLPSSGNNSGISHNKFVSTPPEACPYHTIGWSENANLNSTRIIIDPFLDNSLPTTHQFNDILEREKQIKQRIEENKQNKQACMEMLQEANYNLCCATRHLQQEEDNNNFVTSFFDKLEDRRRKSQQLQDDLNFVISALDAKMQEQNLNALRNQLSCTCKEYDAAQNTNVKLKQDLCKLQGKYQELQKDIHQQSSSFNGPMGDHQEIGKKYEDFENDSLEELARKISRSLLEIEKCHYCNGRLTKDLKETVVGIKQLLDLIHGHRIKQELLKSALSSSTNQSQLNYDLKITSTDTPKFVPSPVESELQFISAVQSIKTLSQTSTNLEFKTCPSSRTTVKEDEEQKFEETEINNNNNNNITTIERDCKSSISIMKPSLLTKLKKTRSTPAPAYAPISISSFEEQQPYIDVCREGDTSSQLNEKEHTSDIITISEEHKERGEVPSNVSLTLEENKLEENVKECKKLQKKVEDLCTSMISANEINETITVIVQEIIDEENEDHEEVKTVENTKIIVEEDEETKAKREENICSPIITLEENKELKQEESEEQNESSLIPDVDKYTKIVEETEKDVKEEEAIASKTNKKENEEYEIEDKSMEILKEAEEICVTKATVVEHEETKEEEESKKMCDTITSLEELQQEVEDVNTVKESKEDVEEVLSTKATAMQHEENEEALIPVTSLLETKETKNNVERKEESNIIMQLQQEVRDADTLKITVKESKEEIIAMKHEETREEDKEALIPVTTLIESEESEKDIEREEEFNIIMTIMEEETEQEEEQSNLNTEIKDKHIVTATITKSGNLEVVAEADDTVVESIITYSKSGTVNITTDVIQNTLEELEFDSKLISSKTLHIPVVPSITQLSSFASSNHTIISDRHTEDIAVVEIDNNDDEWWLTESTEETTESVAKNETTLNDAKELENNIQIEVEILQEVSRTEAEEPRVEENEDRENVTTTVCKCKDLGIGSDIFEMAQNCKFPEDELFKLAESDEESDLEEILSALQYIECDDPTTMFEATSSSSSPEAKFKEFEIGQEKVSALMARISQEEESLLEETTFIDKESDIHKQIEEALEKANKLVMDTLQKTRDNITEALEKVHKNVENVLAQTIIKEIPNKVNKEVGTEDNSIDILDSVPKGYEELEVEEEEKGKKEEVEMEQIFGSYQFKRGLERSFSWPMNLYSSLGTDYWGLLFEKKISDIPRTPIFTTKVRRSTEYDCNDVCGRSCRKKIEEEVKRKQLLESEEESEDKTVFIRTTQWQKFIEETDKSEQEYEKQLTETFLSNKTISSSLPFVELYKERTESAFSLTDTNIQDEIIISSGEEKTTDIIEELVTTIPEKEEQLTVLNTCLSELITEKKEILCEDKTSPEEINEFVEEESRVEHLLLTKEKEINAEQDQASSVEEIKLLLNEEKLQSSKDVAEKNQPKTLGVDIFKPDQKFVIQNSREHRSRDRTPRNSYQILKQEKKKSIKISPLPETEETAGSYQLGLRSPPRRRPKSTSNEKTEDRSTRRSSRKSNSKSPEEKSRLLESAEGKEGKSKSLQQVVTRTPLFELSESCKADHKADVHIFEAERSEINSNEISFSENEEKRQIIVDDSNCLPDSLVVSNVKVFKETKPYGDVTGQQKKAKKDVVYNNNDNQQRHPLECECLDCLCDQSFLLKKDTPDEVIMQHPEICDCLYCRCCTCALGLEGKAKHNTLLPGACLYEQCSVITDTTITSNVVSDSRTLFSDSVTKKISIIQIPYSEEESKNLCTTDIETISLYPDSTNHSANCKEPSLEKAQKENIINIEILPINNNPENSVDTQREKSLKTEFLDQNSITFVTSKIDPPQDYNNNTQTFSLKTEFNNNNFDDTLTTVQTISSTEKNNFSEININNLESEFNSHKQVLINLQETIKQTGCMCRIAEYNSLYSTPLEKSFVAVQKSSFRLTLSGLKLALRALEDKCIEKDRLITIMLNELKLRTSNDKVVEKEIFEKLSKQKMENQEPIDYNRTEICKALPRPKSTLQYRNVCNQLKFAIEIEEQNSSYSGTNNHPDENKSAGTLLSPSSYSEYAIPVAEEMVSNINTEEAALDFTEEIEEKLIQQQQKQNLFNEEDVMRKLSKNIEILHSPCKEIKSRSSSIASETHQTQSQKIKHHHPIVEIFKKPTPSVPVCPCSKENNKRRSKSKEPNKKTTPKPCPNTKNIRPSSPTVPKDFAIIKQQQQPIRGSFGTNAIARFLKSKLLFKSKSKENNSNSCIFCSKPLSPSGEPRFGKKSIPHKNYRYRKYFDIQSFKEPEISLIQRTLGWPKFGASYLNPKTWKK